MGRVGTVLAAVVALSMFAAMGGADAARPEARPARPIAVTLPLPQPTAEVEESPAHSKSCYSGLPRATADRPDEGKNLVHVIYLVAADFPDEGLDRNGTLDCSMRAQNQWFAKQSGGFHWRLDTFRTSARTASGRSKTIDAVDVTFIRSKHRGADLYGADRIRAELQERGFAEGKKRYLTYVAAGDDAGGPCGDAYLDSFDPMSQGDGQFAQVYLFSAEGCHAHEFGVPGAPSYAEAIAQQEIMHNDGAVSLGAPHFCAPNTFHVCTGALSALGELDPSNVDIMFPYVTLPLKDKVLDEGHDDYFDHPFPFKDVATSKFLVKP